LPHLLGYSSKASGRHEPSLSAGSRAKCAGLGKDLLRDAFERIVSASEIIGVRCVLVHAIDDDASKFWKKHEFIEYPDSSRTFFMPVDTIISAL